jgi:hypothetical protein
MLIGLGKDNILKHTEQGANPAGATSQLPVLKPLRGVPCLNHDLLFRCGIDVPVQMVPEAAALF